MHLASLDDARPWGCRRGCCHLFARPLTFECMNLEDLQQIAATVQVKTSWVAAWWYASCIAWWSQTMSLQARLLPSVCKTFDIWMCGSWGFATDCGNRAGEDELTSCLVVCILRRLSQDHQVFMFFCLFTILGIGFRVLFLGVSSFETPSFHHGKWKEALQPAVEEPLMRRCSKGWILPDLWFQMTTKNPFLSIFSSLFGPENSRSEASWWLFWFCHSEPSKLSYDASMTLLPCNILGSMCWKKKGRKNVAWGWNGRPIALDERPGGTFDWMDFVRPQDISDGQQKSGKHWSRIMTWFVFKFEIVYLSHGWNGWVLKVSGD